MPALDPTNEPEPTSEPLTRLPFKPISREHILHCSYDCWFRKYRSSCIKSRIIPLPPAFLSYLREDGIVLPSDDIPTSTPESYNNNSTSDGWDEDPSPDPSLAFAEIHQKIKDTIAELGGLVVPKLNWSSPKDATWISIHKNSMECSTPSDIYLLLKSSSFITHDLTYPFHDTAPPTPSSPSPDSIKYVLVLRPFFKLHPSLEFRCFVRSRTLIAISQRDLNHFPFLFPLQSKILSTIQSFFNSVLQTTFPDAEFTFDIYLPEPYSQCRLIDINPWAPRTDPLLFSWLELLTLPLPAPLLGIPDSTPLLSDDTQDDSSDTEEIIATFIPELRLVRANDPEARNFSTPQYSAHKLPKEVVDASLEGESGMKEFAEQWRRMMNGEVDLQGGSDTESDEEDQEGEETQKDMVHEAEILNEEEMEGAHVEANGT